jgi:hypothetical protein
VQKLCLIALLAFGVIAARPSETAGQREIETLHPDEVPEQVNFMIEGMFLPSLEMRENVDFLTVPACLVQQVLLGAEIVFYPHV